MDGFLMLDCQWMSSVSSITTINDSSRHGITPALNRWLYTRKQQMCCTRLWVRLKDMQAHSVPVWIISLGHFISSRGIFFSLFYYEGQRITRACCDISIFVRLRFGTVLVRWHSTQQVKANHHSIIIILISLKQMSSHFRYSALIYRCYIQTLTHIRRWLEHL